jgi:hypothetical protein
MINSQMAHFFWNNTEDKQRLHLANWPLIAQKKEFGGMGVPNLRDLNLCLLAAWIHRYQLNDNVLWTKIIRHKYKVDHPNIFDCPIIGSSPF